MGSDESQRERWKDRTSESRSEQKATLEPLCLSPPGPSDCISPGSPAPLLRTGGEGACAYRPPVVQSYPFHSFDKLHLAPVL